MGGQCREVSKGIWLVGCGGWGGSEDKFSRPGDANVYLIDGGTELGLVDAGHGPEDPQILENIRAAGFDPKRIGKILLTHAHNDHAEAADWIRKQTGARIYAGPVTARAIREGERGIVGDLEPFQPFNPVKYEVDKEIEDGEEISLGKVHLDVMYTYGHSVDSVCYVTRMGGKKILFSGDTMVGRQTRKDFGGRTFAGMLGWLDGHWSAGLGTYVASLEKLAALKVDLMLPGHGVPNDKETTVGAIKAGIASLKRVMNDLDLYVMFTVWR